MRFLKDKNGRLSVLLVVLFSGLFVLPCLVSGQTNEPPDDSFPGDTPSENPELGSTIEPIDTGNGNNYFTEGRIFVPCPGVPLSVDLKYQSITGNPEGRLGQGWVHSYEWSLDVQSSEAILYTGSGEKRVFAEDTGGGYLSPDGKNWTLEDTGSGYEVGLPGGIVYDFDSSGQLDVIQDAWGNWVECSYGTNGCLEAATHSNDRQVVFSNEWNIALGEWRVASIQVQGGESLLFDYNADGQFTQVIEQVGVTSHTSHYQYADGYLTNKVNGVGFEYSFGYGSVSGSLNGKGISLDVDGYYEHTVSYQTDLADVTYSRERGDQVFRYDRSGVGLTAKYGPADSVQNVQERGIRYAYATAKGFDKTKEEQFDDTVGESFYEWMLYDDAHNMTNYAISYGTTNPVQQFSMEYDPVWQLPAFTKDAEGHRSETIYTNGLPLIVKAFYNASNSYDIAFAYSTNGLPLAITNANMHVVNFGYDSAGNLINTSSELGSIFTNTYDALGFTQSTEVLSESGAHTGRITQYDRDAKGRLLQTTFADGLTSSYAYNALGYLTNSIDRAGRATDFSYAPTEKLTSVTRYLGEGGSNVPVCIGYDLDQQVNVLSITEPRGRYVESYQLDIQDRITSVTNIEGQVMSFDYGVGDFVRQTTRFDGATLTNTYDTAGRKSSVTYSGGTAINYDYYVDDQLKTIADSTSSMTNSYDALNRLTNQVVQVGSLQSEIDNAFDPVGQLTNSIVTIGGAQASATAYTYDAADRLTEISSHDGSETQSFVQVYNPDNGRIASVSNTIYGITTSYKYDLLDRATNIAYRASDGTLIRSLEYAYNANSMITKKRISNSEQGPPSSEVSYIYDSLDRLVYEATSTNGYSMFDIGYSYDLAGNRLSRTQDGILTSYTLGAGNRLASSSTVPTNQLFITGVTDELIGTDNRWGYLEVSNLTAAVGGIPSVNGDTFFAQLPALAGQTNQVTVALRDRAGNMGYASKDYWVGSSGGTTSSSSYVYDAAGNTTNLNGISLEWDERYRLVSASSTSSAVDYSYDVLGRRISRIEGGTTNYFVYNGNQVVADLDGSGNLLRSYVWGQGIDNLLAFTDHSTSNTYYAIKDHQNTVIALTDETGVMVESYEYDAYGNILDVKDDTGDSIGNQRSAIGNRYTFQGREIDWDTGLMYFRARWYNPKAGRWMSKDPKGIAGGLNLYIAFGNNPVNFTDPFGLDEDDDDAWHEISLNWINGRNWNEIGRGAKGMLKASAQILGGVLATQLDSPVVGPADVLGAAIIVDGVADLTLNYGVVVGGLAGVDTENIPDDLLNAAVDAATGDDQAGDAVQEVFEHAGDLL